MFILNPIIGAIDSPSAPIPEQTTKTTDAITRLKAYLDGKTIVAEDDKELLLESDKDEVEEVRTSYFFQNNRCLISLRRDLSLTPGGFQHTIYGGSNHGAENVPLPSSPQSSEQQNPGHGFPEKKLS